MADRRQIMVAMRDRRRNAVENMPSGYGFDDPVGESEYMNSYEASSPLEHNNGSFVRESQNFSDYDSFVNTYKRAQKKEKTKHSLLRMCVKATYLSISLGFISGFAFLINYEKTLSLLKPLIGQTFGEVKTVISQERDVSSANLRLSIPKIEIPDRFERLLESLKLNHISSELHLRDSNTSQAKALDWMVHKDRMMLDPGDKDFIQRYVMATLYFASGGEKWTNSYDWLSDKHECDWNELYIGEMYGSGGCEEDGHIVKIIFLPNNNLIGTIPKEISELKNLRILSVHDNKLRGHISPTLRRFTALKTLYLHGNDFVGDINFLCDAKIPFLRSDCRGNNPEIVCKCCDVCCNSEGFCYPNK